MSFSKMTWKLGKVEQLLPGDDGKVRAAVVKVPRSNGTIQLLKRAVLHFKFPSRYEQNRLTIKYQVN